MRRLLIVLAAVALPFEGHSAGSQAQASAEALEQLAVAEEQAGRVSEAFELYVRAFRALSSVPPLDTDVRIRERILALAPRLQTPLPVPEDAERSLIRGQVLFQDAKNETDIEKAIVEFRNAVRAAPWLPELAFNLALVQEQAAFYRSAAANLKLYVGTNPSDAQEVRRKTYELELRLETDKAAALREDCALGAAQACASIAAEETRRAKEARDAESRRREEESLREERAVSTTWVLSNQCRTKDLRVKFFEATGNERTGVWPADDEIYLLKRSMPDWTLTLTACTPGSLVCYGGDLSWRTYFGIGGKGEKACDDCCVSCGTHDRTLTLSCPGGDQQITSGRRAGER